MLDGNRIALPARFGGLTAALDTAYWVKAGGTVRPSDPALSAR